MGCPACKRENREDAAFCDACGASLRRTCAGCGRELRGDARFCDGCGAPRTPQPSPRAYTPKHLAEKILRSKSALEGERKQVTVLFADVKGSMELAEQLDPEEWHGILDRFFAILTDGVHRFEGTVNQYTGDGIMALFGAPIAHEDHAQRACHAALHLRDELNRYANDLRQLRGVDFSVRMGINSGAVVVGKIGDDLRMDYTAQGHTVGLAQRMEQLAAAHAICVSEATAKAVAGYFTLNDLGAATIKGASERVRVFQLEGVTPQRTRLEVGRARGLSRFVGRDAEMDVLEAALARARAGNGQVIGIVAEAGTGKSRLCFELTERCRAAGMRVIEACETARQRLPADPALGAEFTGYSPFLGILNAQAWMLARLGRLGEAAAACDRAEHLARVHGDTEVLTWLQLPRIELDVSCANTAAARDHARCALETGEKSATPQAREVGLIVLGIAHRLNTEWDESVAMLEEAVRAAISGVNRMNEAWVRAELAEALLGRGEVDRAEHEAQAAVTVAHAQHSRCDEVRAHLALAHTQLHRADAAALARAEQALARAQELIDETSAQAYQPEVHECRAHVARLRGHELAAQREIEQARRLYAEMGATAQVARLANETAR